jgi:phosphatidate cytidylyltransferase
MATILIPAALFAAWMGQVAFAIFSAIAGIAMAFEWARMAHGPNYRWHFVISSAGICGAFLALLVGYDRESWGLLLIAALAAAIAAKAKDQSPIWPVFGLLYVGLACLAMVWLRGLTVLGFETVVWLLIVVWATDSAAFAFGTTFGGPKLAPAISPNKTWAGAIGGVIAAGAASWVFAKIIGAPMAALVTAIGAALAIATQLGDLGESVIKRRFRVKNTSEFLPGHGGVLDRLDGLIAATAMLSLLTAWRGVSPLVWS